MGTIYEEDDEMVIDLREIFFAVKKKFFLILMVGLLGACVSAAYTIMFVEPVYKSTSSMLVLSKETTLTSIADLQLGTQLTKDYTVLITSTPVLEDVIKNLNLETTPEALRQSISIVNPSDTRIIDITVKNTDPIMAKKIVDEVSLVASDFVGDKMEVIPPKIIEKGKIPTIKAEPSLKKNVFLGLLLGLMLSGGIVVLFVIMDDSIKSEEDITKYLGISTLAVVPDRKDYIDNKRASKKRKNKKKNGGR